MIDIKYGVDLCEVTTDMADGVFYFDIDYIESHTEDEIEWDCMGVNTFNCMVDDRIDNGLYDDWEGF